MLQCADLGEELRRVVSVFSTHLQSRSAGTQQLVLRGVLQLSKRQDTARKMLGLLPCITKQLQDADSGARAVALPVLSTLLRLLEGRKLSLAALELAGNLPALFEDESGTVRQLSIHLFLDTLSFVEGREKKKMRKEVYRSLVSLCLHLHDEEESVAKASQEAFLGAARFLRWRRLEHLAEMAQFSQISECMLAERRKSAGQDYLGQSLLYLQSPQESLRREAARFIGLIGQHKRDQHHDEREDIYKANSDGMRGNGLQSCQGRSPLDVRKNVLAERAVGHGHRLLGELGESPSLEAFKNRGDVAPRDVGSGQARKHCGGVRRVDASPSAFSSANTPGSSGAASGTGPLTLRWLQEPPPSCLGAQGPELSSWEV
ncbi:maestro heat-like repeat family member 5 [Cyrtonyx montezumae]|uniref:maestro heat-like repeat family member 5 n=1 Tax=Cyrtonyx montezumae TaxID=9017 RepID=UPI0032DBD613